VEVQAPVVARCAAHPARPAHDSCPTCGRPRCTVDARDRGHRCAVCARAGGAAGTARASGAAGAGRPPLVATVGAAAIGTVLCVVGSAVGQEYVGARLFSWVFPALVGVVIASLVLAWTGPLAATVRAVVGGLCSAYAAISALLDFRFTHEPYGPTGRWLPPLAAGVAAAAVTVLVLGRRPAAPAPGSGAERQLADGAAVPAGRFGSEVSQTSQ